MSAITDSVNGIPTIANKMQTTRPVVVTGAMLPYPEKKEIETLSKMPLTIARNSNKNFNSSYKCNPLAPFYKVLGLNLLCFRYFNKTAKKFQLLQSFLNLNLYLQLVAQHVDNLEQL